MKEERKLTIAEQEVVRQIRRWPTLYHSAHSFFHKAIVGSQGCYYWHKGILIHGDKNRKICKDGKVRTHEYPYRISEDVARSFINNNASGFMCVYPLGETPISTIPDDAHKDWLDFIHFHLFLDSKITPELYEIIVQANSVRHYGVTHNPHSSGDHYRSEWAKYFAKIPSYQSHIRLIREMRLKGAIPADRYMGMDI